MNELNNYQRFVQSFFYLKNSKNTEYDSIMPGQSGLNKDALHKKLGITLEEDKIQLEKRRTKMLIDSVQMSLEKAKTFEIDESAKKILLFTDAPTDKNILKEARLPFPSMFFDIHLKKEEVAQKVDFDEIYGLLVYHAKTDEKSDSDLLYLAYCGKIGRTTFIQDLIIPIYLADGKHIHYNASNDTKFFREFILNLLLFINHPEVEYVYFDRDEKNNKRREKQGKMRLPGNYRVLLTGKIKRYINNFTALVGEGYDHKFWVRGHWRTLKAERYKEAKGKILWIEPFLKGKGDIEEHIYRVEND